MNQQQRDFIADRLQATVVQLEKLPYKHFYYGSFVEKIENGCGTICCVAGWYPQWFPNAGLAWDKKAPEGSLRGRFEKSIGIVTKKTPHGENTTDNIKASLCSYHMISDHLADVLFFGTERTFHGIRYYAENGLDSRKREVIRVFKGVIADIRKGKLDQHLSENCPTTKTKKVENEPATT